MLIKNRLSRPATWTIEFCDDMLSILEANVIYAIFEGIEGETMPRGNEARRLDGLEDTLRREAEKELA